MKIRQIKTPKGLIDIDLPLSEYRVFMKRLVRREIQNITFNGLFNGSEWIRTERDKWENYAKFLR